MERIRKREASWSEEKTELDSKFAMEVAQRQSLQSSLREIEIRHKLELQELQDNAALQKTTSELELSRCFKDVAMLREELNATKSSSVFGIVASSSSSSSATPKKNSSTGSKSANNRKTNNGSNGNGSSGGSGLGNENGADGSSGGVGGIGGSNGSNGTGHGNAYSSGSELLTSSLPSKPPFFHCVVYYLWIFCFNKQ